MKFKTWQYTICSNLQPPLTLNVTTMSKMLTGVWSPGATPEAQRKEFNFKPVKEESAQEATEDAEPVQPVWTPRSAQASPTSERKFRPVNFESPKLARKTYNKPSEVRNPSHASQQ